MTSLILLGLIACGDQNDKTTDTGTDSGEHAHEDETPTDPDDSGTNVGTITSGHGGTGCDTHTPTEQVATLSTSADPTNIVYFDLDTNTAVTESDDWDLKMYSWNVEMNAGVQTAIFPDYWDAFADFCAAPPHGFITDPFAMEDWYDYDFETHELSPKDVIYFVQTVEGNYRKLRFDSYDLATDGHTPVFTHADLLAL